MRDLTGLKISLCQMSVTPGRPDLNAAYIIKEIREASKRSVDIIAFPEMCTTGYLIGDILEDIYFIEDVAYFNKQIIEATRSGIAVLFGTVVVSSKRGEDGRHRMHNAAVVAENGRGVITENGKEALFAVKSLQPNYRFYNDDKHLYSLRKTAEEEAELFRLSGGREGQENCSLHDRLQPFPIQTNLGVVDTGVILCEDMWHLDYAFNPARTLVRKGAKIIFNLSASPWTWQKNRKRHQVVRDLLRECRVPLVYVNNTGTQNTGKNIIVFDGSSTVYREDGEIIFGVSPYENGSYDFIFSNETQPVELKPQSSQTRPEDDTGELYAAMTAASKSAVPAGAKIIVGLSGGIDSATVAAHMVDIFGPPRVLAVNMPFLNSPETRDIARQVCTNLGIAEEVIPIKELVEPTLKLSGVQPGTLAYENIQARARKDILAALAQKIGGVFTCNSNKVEVAFGYGTLYGDIAGFYAPLGDLVKREVRQIADYLNRVRFGREVIPPACINQIPTAELAENQKDPFDYGDLERRGYHDEMVRAYTEFRKNPEWFLELYLKGRLEDELKLESGTLQKLFSTPADFIKDLEDRWYSFHGSFFKRIQCPPIPIFSRRAFGRDLEESLMSPYFTRRFLYLKRYVLSQKKSRKNGVAIFGGSFNPPSLHHRLIVERLGELFELVIVVPCGIRSDKSSVAKVTLEDRRAMVALAFQDLDRIELDFYDFEHNTFTPTYALEERYLERFKNKGLWFVVGGDLIKGGGQGKSEIQTSWRNGENIWPRLNFVVIAHPGSRINPADLPPLCEMVQMDVIIGRGTIIRERIAQGETIDNLVLPEVAQYIKERGLYR